MAFKKIKEGSSFNINHKFFLIEEDDDLQELEQLYSCEQGDIAELPTGAQYIRNSIGEWILQPLSDDGGSGGSSISGTINISSNGIKSVAGYSQANVNVQPQVSLQNKTVTPTTSNQSISADIGYTGLGTVTVQGYSLQNKTVTPTAASQDIAADNGYAGLSTVIIQGDNNLVASNIKKDVQIFGTTGNYEVETVYLSEAPANDVEFIDYNGDRLYSYSKAEFLALEELPQNPTHEGLTAQGWNWTLSDAKVCVNQYDKLVIGQNYITSDGKTRIYVYIPEERLSTQLCFNGKGTIDIDWGDGTTKTLTPIYNNTTIEYHENHNYLSPGLYIITLTVPNNSLVTLLGDGDSPNTSRLLMVQNSASSISNRTNNYGQYQNIKKIEIGENVTFDNGAFSYCKNLEEITIPQNIKLYPMNCFYFCIKLKGIVIPNGTSTLSHYAFKNSYLKRISLPKTISTIGGSAFYQTPNLEKICLPYITALPMQSFYESGVQQIIISNDLTQITDYCFYGCTNLEYINIPTSLISIGVSGLRSTKLSKIILPTTITTIDASALSYIYSLKSIIFEGTTPPVFNDSSWAKYSGTWLLSGSPLSDLVIYVPQASLETYNNTTNFLNPSYYTVKGY